MTAPGGEQALACGQAPEGRAYWSEYAFCDLEVRGPRRAKGMIVWSHGVSGQRETYRSRVPPVIRRLAVAGWDVVRINRNNLNERGWGRVGAYHVEEAVLRLRAAREAGYRHVIAAGQSYGGAISIGANAAAPGLLHATLAFSPGHGSDAAQPNNKGRYLLLDDQLLAVVGQQKTGRLVMLLPSRDHLHPNRDDNPFGPRMRPALQATGLPFMYFDETLPLEGHGTGGTVNFNRWYGACIEAFVDPARVPRAGETVCPAEK